MSEVDGGPGPGPGSVHDHMERIRSSSLRQGIGAGLAEAEEQSRGIMEGLAASITSKDDEIAKQAQVILDLKIELAELRARPQSVEVELKIHDESD